MATNKSWHNLTSDLAETFRKWKVIDWGLEPEKQPAQRNRYSQRTVKVRWRKLGKSISLVCASESTAQGNLQLLSLAIETLRLNEVRKVDGLVAGAYGIMHPPAAPPPSVYDAVEKSLLDPQRNPYGVLGVTPNYPLSVIETIWKAHLRVAHPDVGGNEEQAKLLNAAMEEIWRRRKP
ncbi:MAG: hypothetical protein U0350_40090 [Caldilineaceae bacterium]